MEKGNEKVQKIDSLFIDLLENTTIHGLPKVSSSRRIAVKILWLGVFVAAVALFILQLDGLIKEYKSNPKQTTITLQSGTVKFPAITVCNMNVVKHSTVPLQPQLSELVNSNFRYSQSASFVNLNPLESDIFEFILDGYTIPKWYRSRHFARYGYWEMIEYLSSLYHLNNITSHNVDPQTTLLSRNELLMLIGEDIQTSTVTVSTTSQPTTSSPDLGSDNSAAVNESVIDGSEPDGEDDDSSPVAPIVKLAKLRRSTHPEYRNFFKGILDKSEYEQPMHLWKTRHTLFHSILRQQKSDIRSRLGHQFEDLMMSSYFQGVQENVTNKRYWTSDYGNCYTIDSPRYETRHSGPGHGFDLLLNLEMDEYISKLQESRGVKIVLHEQGTVPIPNAEGITLAPGYEHQIALKIVKTSRLGPPYGTCTDGQQFLDKYKTKYTRKTCTEVCKIELYVNECGCMPYDSTEIVDKYVDLPVCKFSMDSSVKACAKKIQLQLDSERDNCGCVEPCRTTSYLKTISGRPWPTDNYMINVIVHNMCPYDGRILPSLVKICHAYWVKQLDVGKYRKNFMKIQIYFEDTQYQVMTEEPTYGVVRFLSDVGGTAGLFIGASVLSIVEIVQVILEVILHLRKTRKLSQEPMKGVGRGEEISNA